MDDFRHRKHMEWKQNRIDIYEFILKYSKAHKSTPPTRIISDELEISMTAVQRHLRQFEEDGLIEILERFGISKWVFQRYLDNGDLLEGKYRVNDYDCDIKARKCKDRELFLQFDVLTKQIRRAVGGKAED